MSQYLAHHQVAGTESAEPLMRTDSVENIQSIKKMFRCESITNLDLLPHSLTQSPQGECQSLEEFRCPSPDYLTMLDRGRNTERGRTLIRTIDFEEVTIEKQKMGALSVRVDMDPSIMGLIPPPTRENSRERAIPIGAKNYTLSPRNGNDKDFLDKVVNSDWHKQPKVTDDKANGANDYHH